MKIDNTQSGYASALQNPAVLDQLFHEPIEVICGDDDFDALHYLFLIAQRENRACRLHISASNQTACGSIRAKVSSYLACVRRDILISDKVFADQFRKTDLQDMRDTALGKILPLIEIDLETHLFLSDCVKKQFVTDCVNGRPCFALAALNKRGASGYLLSPENGVQNEQVALLRRTCGNYLFHKGELPKRLAEMRLEYFTSPDFYEQVQGLSTLAFLLLCAHEKTITLDSFDQLRKSRKKKGIYKDDELKPLLPQNIYDLIISAADMADGLNQLIENVVFHAGSEPGKGKGFLSFRIYSGRTDSGEDNDYLHRTYPYYLAGMDNRQITTDDATTAPSSLRQLETWRKNPPMTANALAAAAQNQREIDNRKKKRTAVRFYLEVKLTDCSGKNMCVEFEKNVHSRMRCSLFERSSVSTFFNPNQGERELWKKYSTEPENAIHHYGLQLFDALVQGLDGCVIASTSSDGRLDKERDIYSTSGDVDTEGTCVMPGTHFSILLPFQELEEQEYSFLNTTVRHTPEEADLQYTIYDQSTHHSLKDYSNLLSSGLLVDSPKSKQDMVSDLCMLLPDMSMQRSVMVFDAINITPKNVELFAKSLMQFIALHRDRPLHIAVRGCSRSHFSQIARMFAVFYDRAGNNGALQNTQLYLAGQKSPEEFLLAGANLQSALVTQIKLSASRGVETASSVTNLLINMLKRRPGKGDNTTIRPLAFDLLIKDSFGTSVFERNITDVLTRDLQLRNPGSRISPNHTRVGSKVHVDRFYEAEMLFYNNYYTDRFALLLRQIIATKRSDAPLLLVGYETYSEMLVRELARLCGDACYCIFEYATIELDEQDQKKRDIPSEGFRHTELISDDVCYQVAYICPINTTLSTFNKLEAAFEDECAHRGWRTEEQRLYLGVILIRHGHGNDDLTKMEERFFSRINPTNRTIGSHYLPDDAHYLVAVNSQWEDPLRCQQCYPSSYFCELPLIETDKTSVIPSQMFGLRGVQPVTNATHPTLTQSGTVESLKGHVEYRHMLRHGNHFQYYIRTDRYLHDERNYDRILTWLREDVAPDVAKRSNARLHYDILVCPAHYSNTSFVKAVNDEVFGGASLILCVDVDKEFRDNFKAKHSDLCNLYDNLLAQSCAADLNFHFVDDTIVHGASIARVSSLLHSLFPPQTFLLEENQQIHIHAFRSIILLVNRLSSDSILHYVNNQANFYSFLDLHISSMRTHGDACILCAERHELLRLSQSATFNDLARRFYLKYRDLRQQNVREFEQNLDIQPTEEEKPLNKRGFLRMCSTHYINLDLNHLSDKNDECQVFSVFVKGMYAIIKNIESEQCIDQFISYLVVASSPFLSFRKSNREAIFSLMLLLFETLLSDKSPSELIRELGASVIYEIKNAKTGLRRQVMRSKLEMLENQQLLALLEAIRALTDTDPQQYLNLLKALIKQSVLLRSTFVLRRQNIERILRAAYVRDKQTTDFEIFFLYYFKRLINTGSDEAKSQYLEYLLLFDQEYDGKNTDMNSPATNPQLHLPSPCPVDGWDSANALIRNFYSLLYLENTKILYRSALDLEKGRSPDDDKTYIFESFDRLLVWNSEQKDKISGALRRVLKRLEDNGKESGNGEEYVKIADYYTLLCTAVADLAHASLPDKEAVELYFLSRRGEEVFQYNQQNRQLEKVTRFVLDCFASSDNQFGRYNTEGRGNVTAVVEELAVMLNTQDSYVLDTLLLGESTEKRLCLIRIDQNIGGVGGDKEAGSVFIGVTLPQSLTAFEQLRALRYILLFRSCIAERVSADFGNNLLQQTLEQIETHKQLRKARAGYHDEEGHLFSPYYYAKNILFEDGVDQKYLHFGAKEAVFGYLANTAMGRINLKVLAHGDLLDFEDRFPDPDITDKARTKQLAQELAVLRFHPMKNHLLLCASHIPPRMLKDLDAKFFQTLFAGRLLRKNKEGLLPKFLYFVSITSDLLVSAFTYAPKSLPDEIALVNIDIDDSNGVLWVRNEVNEDFDDTVDKINEGLLRKSQGISLAAICGFFEALHGSDDSSGWVRIEYDERIRRYSIGLPLFERQEGEQHDHLSV